MSHRPSRPLRWHEIVLLGTAAWLSVYLGIIWWPLWLFGLLCAAVLLLDLLSLLDPPAPPD